jgi:periplasmic protein TonB
LNSWNHHWRCRKCGSPCLRRSRTRIWERPLRLLLIRPCRCRDCEHRCYVFIWPHGRTILDQLRFMLGRQFSAEESARVRSGKRWRLLYGLLTCFLVALGSFAFRNAFLNQRSTNGTEWSRFAPSGVTQVESPEREATAVKSSPPAPAKRPTADLSPQHKSMRVPAASSARSAEQLTPFSHASGSSSAQAIRAERPKIPANLKSAISSENKVEVRVHIDESGKVTDAVAVSATGAMATSLVRYSLETARRWRFRPARNNGKPVRSDRVLEFLFRPSDG